MSISWREGGREGGREREKEEGREREKEEGREREKSGEDVKCTVCHMDSTCGLTGLHAAQIRIHDCMSEPDCCHREANTVQCGVRSGTCTYIASVTSARVHSTQRHTPAHTQYISRH